MKYTNLIGEKKSNCGFKKLCFQKFNFYIQTNARGGFKLMICGSEA